MATFPGPVGRPPFGRRPLSIRGSKSARILLALSGILFLGLPFVRTLAGAFTDYLWFLEVDLGEVWRGLLWARVAPFIVFGGVFFVAALGSFSIADRLRPRLFIPGMGDDIVEQYREIVGRHQRKVRVGVALFVGVLAGGGAAARWMDWVLYLNRVDFGVRDPEFGKDIGFYFFQLPLYTGVIGWTIAVVSLIAIFTALAYYLNGGIRPQGPGERVAPHVKVHLSVLLAALALLKAGSYYFQRFELSFSTRGVVHGASATDVATELPALTLLSVILVLAALLFLLNIWMRGWALPAIAVGLSAVVWLVLLVIVPGAYQRFAVEPNEGQREKPYIERNLEATRRAFALDSVKTVAFPYAETLTPEKVDANRDAIDRVRIWDPDELRSSYAQLQEIRPFYKFLDVDLDRYEIEGKMTQVGLSTREINADRLPSRSWQAQHLFYTHGQGVAMSPVGEASEDGRPLFYVQDVPARSELIDLVRPEIYFGELTGDYVVARTGQREFDYEREGQPDRTTRYEGRGGVRLSNFVRKAAFALRFGDLNPLVSKQVTSESRVLFARNVSERVRKAAPFLEFDADPYPVIADGRVVWVVDAYTVSDRYPYSQAFSPASGRLSPGSDLVGRYNYVRNSVKATVDAYDGTLRFYVVDEKDPLARAYRKAFPSMFRRIGEMPDTVREHLRYPEDLLKVQADVYAVYHVEDPQARFSGSDQWVASPDPETGRVDIDSSAQRQTTTTVAGAVRPTGSTSKRMDPYYLLMRSPGAERERFTLVQPFVPVSGDGRLVNLVSFLTGTFEADQGARLEAVVMPRGKQVFGPAQVDAQIQNTPSISEQLTLLNQSGSEVLQGTLQLIPVDDSLLYVRPIYVQGARGGLPEPRFVAVFYAGRAAMGGSLQDALAQLFGSVPPSTPRPVGPGPARPPGEPADVDALIESVVRAYEEGQAALRAGDLAGYQRAVDRMGSLVKDLQAARGAGGG